MGWCQRYWLLMKIFPKASINGDKIFRWTFHFSTQHSWDHILTEHPWVDHDQWTTNEDQDHTLCLCFCKNYRRQCSAPLYKPLVLRVWMPKTLKRIFFLFISERECVACHHYIWEVWSKCADWRWDENSLGQIGHRRKPKCRVCMPCHRSYHILHFITVYTILGMCHHHLNSHH